MKHSNDFLDMRNDFLFTGMAVIRNQSYGMTSCGTGGVWSVTSMTKLDDFFFGRTMIEDTASSIAEFVNGRKAAYVAPFASKEAHLQLMCAVPKVSANYLEALERWDTGAIQCLCAQALGRPWFWVAQTCALLTMAIVVVPAWFTLGAVAHVSSWADFIALFNGGKFWLLPCPDADDVSGGRWNCDPIPNYPLMAVLVALVSWVVIFVLLFGLSHCAPRKLNFILRTCILYFNVTYPINAIAS